MRVFDYKKDYRKLLSADIVSLLTAIHEYKGKQFQITNENADVLTKLVEIAKIQSTDASNKIEGISTSDDRLQKIVKEKTRPKTRSEKEIAGYRDVLSTIHESYDYIPPRSSMILQLHRDLYKFTGSSIGGNYKNSDNVIAEEHADGTKTVRFQPVPAWETPEYVNAICAAYDDALHDGEIDALALIPMFILDFLCIHPFNDGNGRMSRLLTLLLLYRAGYTVGKYISIEKLIADSNSNVKPEIAQKMRDYVSENNLARLSKEDIRKPVMFDNFTSASFSMTFDDSSVGGSPYERCHVDCGPAGMTFRSIETALGKILDECRENGECILHEVNETGGGFMGLGGFMNAGNFPGMTMQPQGVSAPGSAPGRTSSPAVAAADPPSAAGDTWTCTCGQKNNTGKFCPNCGNPSPAYLAALEKNKQ